MADYLINVRERKLIEHPYSHVLIAGDFNIIDDTLLENFSDLEKLPTPATRNNNTLDKNFCTSKEGY